MMEHMMPRTTDFVTAMGAITYTAQELVFFF